MIHNEAWRRRAVQVIVVFNHRKEE